MKKCGMRIAEMQEYTRLCLEGKSSIPRRKEMLANKKVTLHESIKELEACIDYIEYKQNFYDEVLSGARPYTSNLLRLDDENEDTDKR